MEYKELYLPEHHRSKVNGCVDEHIIIAEIKLNRKLFTEEVVHHIDYDKSNNSIDNLMIFKNGAAHTTYHHGGELIPLSNGTFDCKSKYKEKYCLNCKSKIYCYNKTGYCKQCYNKILRKVKDRPTKEQLIGLLKDNSYISIGKKYGVSDNTIRKWLK